MCNNKSDGQLCIFLMDTSTNICVNSGNLCTIKKAEYEALERREKENNEESTLRDDDYNKDFWERFKTYNSIVR